ncbi:hypothetical protein [Flavobacterium phage FL-1]|nr:hypothetical protein [Flavobacterium phage FL-1]
MNNNSKRVGRLTSSNASLFIVAGTKGNDFGKGALTYIDDKRKEIEYGRGLSLPINKIDVLWGKVWEPFVHWQLGNDYKMIVDETTLHPKYSFWSGTQDFTVEVPGGCIAELKSFQLSNHYDYVKVLQQQNIPLLKKEYADAYWQIVSNSCIHKTKYGEAIAFMPTEKQLIEMRKLLEESDYIIKFLKDDKPFKYMWIVENDLYDLPFIPSHSDFPSLVKFRFEVPVEDKVLLTEKMIKAGELLLA